MNLANGSAYNCGFIDAIFGASLNPHKFEGTRMRSPLITMEFLSKTEIKEYFQGAAEGKTWR